MEEFSKQETEAFVIAGDFRQVLATGEQLVEVNCDVTAWDVKGKVDATAEVLTAGTKTVSGSQLLIQVQGGVDKKNYQVTFIGRTSAAPANTWKIDVLMKVANESA